MNARVSKSHHLTPFVLFNIPKRWTLCKSFNDYRSIPPKEASVNNNVCVPYYYYLQMLVLSIHEESIATHL